MSTGPRRSLRPRGPRESAGSTYFQLPSGRRASSGTGHTGGVAGGLSDSGGANDIHAVGISALALLQLQRASSLLPAPAPLPDIRELDSHELTQLKQVARRTGVAWTVLASAQRLGLKKGQSLTKAGQWLKSHGATGNAAKPFASQEALAAYSAPRTPASAPPPWPRTTGPSARSASRAAWPRRRRGSVTSCWPTKSVSVYGGGRADLQQHRIDPRVVMAMR